MSNPRFTPITSDLLARKGDAMPSTMSGKPSLFWRRPPLAETSRDLRMTSPEAARDLRMVMAEPLRAAHVSEIAHEFHGPDHEPAPAGVVPPMVPPEGPRPHKMMVTLSHGDYEKLGIAAVKKGITRQQMLRVAVDLHIDRLKREYGGCGCMAIGGTGQCGEGCGAA